GPFSRSKRGPAPVLAPLPAPQPSTAYGLEQPRSLAPLGFAQFRHVDPERSVFARLPVPPASGPTVVPVARTAAPSPVHGNPSELGCSTPLPLQKAHINRPSKRAKAWLTAGCAKTPVRCFSAHFAWRP